MKTTDVVVRTLSLVFVAALAVTSVSAASLIGKVTEIHEGDLVTIMSLNKPVKIRLMAIDAPDKDQAFADIAKQHLAHLVFDKFVVVEYSGLVQSQFILGKMFVGDRDVGAQMLRDGVAWYDASAATRLTPQERETYDASEKLARSERRGLWQDEAPVAPWAYRESVELQARLATMKALEPKKEQPKPLRQPQSSLTTDDVMLAVGGRGGSLRVPELTGDDAEWKTLSPAGYPFSIRVPATALERGIVVPTATGSNVEYNATVGRVGYTTYMVAWGRGPRTGVPASSLFDEAASRFTSKVNEGLSKTSTKVSFDLVRMGDIKSGPAIGAEYKLTAGEYRGLLRVFTRETKGETQIFLIGAFNTQEHDPTVSEFFRSLDFGKPKVEATAKKKVDEEATP